MKVKKPHLWNLKPAQAVALQNRLSQKICLKPLKTTPKLAAGIDCAFTKDKKCIIAAVVTIEIAAFEVIETQWATLPLTMPYIPGLLSFREAPACIEAVKKLKTTPDIFLIDGQGIAHPRQLGLASHLGLFLDKPTVGCAKSRLVGTYQMPAKTKGSRSALYDKDQNIIGSVLRTRTNVKPMFISPGHKCSLDDAAHITLKLTTKYRLPEPTRTAHQTVSKLKTQC